MDTLCEVLLSTPLGQVTTEWRADSLRGIGFGECSLVPGTGRTVVDGTPPTEEGRALLGALCRYFDGEVVDFSGLELDTSSASPFFRAAWESTRRIPYGKTWSYGELAASIGKPGAARAAGMAMSRNRYPIVIPCHRVIGANGSLVGFGGRLEWKQALLDLERFGVRGR